MSISVQDDCGHLALKRRFCSLYIAQQNHPQIKLDIMSFGNSGQLLGIFSSDISINMMKTDAHGCTHVMLLSVCGVKVDSPPFTKMLSLKWKYTDIHFANLSKTCKSRYLLAKTFSLILIDIWAPI